MDEVTTTIIAKALDGLDRRYAFTAQNIANANTENYQPVRVTFEDDLRAAAASGVDAIAQVEPRVFTDPAAQAQGLRLDLELATASQTAARYRALITLLGSQMALHRAVVTNGGR